MNNLLRWFRLLSLLLIVPLGFGSMSAAAQPASSTYYVSSSMGSDANNGLSETLPLASIAKVNALNLLPGDRVLLKCGDIWRADPLILSKSGSESAAIEISSYPAGCAAKPVLSGSRAIGGWVMDAGSVYKAALSDSDFPLGINQLFRSGQRLTLGRWPNLDAPNAGYAFVEGHTAGGNQITDNELPAIDWSGAIVHIKNIRWSMLDRQVTASSSHTLTLNTGLSCLISAWGSCSGWGYFINNHRATLDQDGEWFYDKTSRQVYLYSSSGPPANIEGSVVLSEVEPIRDGGILLSNGAATAYVVIDNLEIRNWFNHGIGTPGGMNGDIYHHLTLRNLLIKDVDGAGVNLSSWLERPPDGRKGLRGGHHLVFTNNIIDGANDFGITGYFADSTFEDNLIRNIALIPNLGKSGMGCGLTTGECTENGDGFRIRLYQVSDSGHGNVLRRNRFEKIGYNGVDVFGPETILENNLISQACYTKADCGGVRVFGEGSLASTTVYNIHLLNNLIVDIPGNVDGCHPSRAAFGMGLYIDNYSRNVETVGNTIINTSVSGILYQRSSGQITGNTIFNASSGTAYSAQIDLGGSETQVTMSGNIGYGLNPNAWTLYTSALGAILSSDNNYFFQPYVSAHIAYGPSWTRQTFAQWQTLSRQEAHSKTNWFSQSAGEPSRAKAFYNASSAPLTVSLGSRQYLDLDQKPVLATLTLPPFSSKILVDNGPAPLALQGMTPNMRAVSAAGFTLSVVGNSFSASSVVRWAGKDRPTTFVDTTHLTAVIAAADVSLPGNFAVMVHDPLPAPNGSDTQVLYFHVVAAEYDQYLPVAVR